MLSTPPWLSCRGRGVLPLRHPRRVVPFYLVLCSAPAAGPRRRRSPPMRLVPAALVATAVVLISSVTLRAQSSEPSPAVTVPRLINISGVFQPADGQPPAAGGGRHAVDLRRAGGRARRCGRRRRVSRSMPPAATRCCWARHAPTASRPRCLRRARRSGWGCVFARRGRSRRAARADHERAVCAAGVGRRHARRPAGLGATCWRRRRCAGGEPRAGGAGRDGSIRRRTAASAARHDELPRAST